MGPGKTSSQGPWAAEVLQLSADVDEPVHPGDAATGEDRCSERDEDTGAALAMAGLGYFALLVAIADIALLLAALVATWYAHGRDVLPARNLFAIPRYAAVKFMLYPRMLWAGHPRFWIRTDRARRG